MPDRYYSSEPIQAATATLSGNEAHHLLHVMRAKPGFELVLFDGRGGEYEAEVVACGRGTVEVALGDWQDIERELPFVLTLAVALPKGDRQRWLVEKAVELGVTTLVPLQAHRSVCRAAPAKFDRYVVEASKQCCRNRLMEIAPSTTWEEFSSSATAVDRLLAHPGGQPLAEFERQPDSDLCIAIGPEGGFTEDEVAMAIDAAWRVVDLGSRILRVETAAVALISAVALR